MTVTTKISRRVIDASGGWAGPLTHDFMIEAADQVSVFADEVELVGGVDYTVSDIGDPDGYSVTITAPGAWAPAVWVLNVEYSISQPSDVDLGGRFGHRFEAALDRVVRGQQTLADQTRRAVKAVIDTPLEVELLIEPAAEGHFYKAEWDGNTQRLVDGGDASDIANAQGYAQEAKDARDAAQDAEAGAETAAEQAIAAASSVTAPKENIAAVEADAPLTDPGWYETAGYATAGDGGGALYKKVVSEPSHAGKVQNANGTWYELAAPEVRPQMFGAALGGSPVGNQTAINAAIDFVVARGGGAVHIVGGGVLVTRRVTLKSDVYLIGDGRSILKLADGANENLVEGENYLTLTGTNSGAGVHRWGLLDLLLDGNRDNNAVGHCVAVYGRDFVLDNIYTKDAPQRGFSLEYGTGAVGSSPFNGNIGILTSDRSGEEGLYLDVSDTHIAQMNAVSASLNADNTFSAVVFMHGARANKITCWTKGFDQSTAKPKYCIDIQFSGVDIDLVSLEQGKTANINIEGRHAIIRGQSYSMDASGTAHVILNEDRCTIDLLMIGTGSNAVPGLQVGTAGRASSGSSFDLVSNNLDVAVNIVNDGAGNVGKVTGVSGAGMPGISGTPSTTSDYSVVLTGLNKFIQKRSLVQVVSAGSTQGNAALVEGAVCRVTGADGTRGVILPDTMWPGQEITIVNIVNSILKVYPPSGWQFEGRADNLAIEVPGRKSVRVVCTAVSPGRVAELIGA